MAADLVPLSRVLLDRVAALGVDVAALLRRAGVAPSQLEVARPVVTTREYFPFWRALGDLSPGPAAARAAPPAQPGRARLG